MGQRESWAPLPSLLLCKAYVEASMDPKRGNSQAKEVFATRVLKVYNRLLSEAQVRGENIRDVDRGRTANGLVQRFRTIREASIKFVEHRQRVQALELTGNLKEDDYLRIATASYYGDMSLGQHAKRNLYRYVGGNPVKPARTFPHMKSYIWLRTTLFWEQKLHAIVANRTQKNASKAVASAAVNGQLEVVRGDSCIDVPVDAVGASEIGREIVSGQNRMAPKPVLKKSTRPCGTKREAEAARLTEAMFKGAEGILGLAAESKRQNDIKKEFLAEKKRESRMQLFQMVGTDPDLLQRYRMKEQQKALRELELAMEDGGYGGSTNANGGDVLYSGTNGGHPLYGFNRDNDKNSSIAYSATTNHNTEQLQDERNVHDVEHDSNGGITEKSQAASTNLSVILN